MATGDSIGSFLNNSNANKLSSLLTQLKKIQVDMVDEWNKEKTSQVGKIGTSIKAKEEQVVVNVDSNECGSSGTVPSSTAVGDTTGSVSFDTVVLDHHFFY